MSLAARILSEDIKAIDAGVLAHQMRQGLYITDTGTLVIAPHARPGWQRIAIKIKSPTLAHLVPEPCAA